MRRGEAVEKPGAILIGGLVTKARGANPRFRTKKSLAEAVGMSLEYIRRIELGLSYPSGRVLEDIILRTGMDPKDASSCWKALVDHQLDDAVRRHVQLSSDRTDRLNRMIPKAAQAAMAWVALFYTISDEDRADMEIQIARTLMRK